jgi:hypothetical protein
LEDDNLQMSKLIDLVSFPEKNECVKKQGKFLMFVCTAVLYKYIKSHSIDLHNLFDMTHVRIKIYQEFYHCIVYIANEGRHNIIKK